MHRCMQLIFILVIVVFFINPLSAQEKRGIGIFPFDNLSNAEKYDWISFGMEYLLSNKLSNAAAFYVPEKNIIAKALGL